MWDVVVGYVEVDGDHSGVNLCQHLLAILDGFKISQEHFHVH